MNHLPENRTICNNRYYKLIISSGPSSRLAASALRSTTTEWKHWTRNETDCLSSRGGWLSGKQSLGGGSVVRSVTIGVNNQACLLHVGCVRAVRLVHSK